MRFRRRRGPKAVWLPVSCHDTNGSSNGITSSHSTGSWQITYDAYSPFFGDPDTAAHTVGAAAPTMASIIGPGSQYSVRRIIGNVFADMAQGANFDSHCWVAFGIYVTATDQDGTLLTNPATGQNPFTILGDSVTYTPVRQAESTRKRWIHRKVWHLGNAASTVVGRDAIIPPESNAWFPGLNNGTNFDIKTKALVRYEQRLFFQWEVIGGSPGAPNTASVTVQVADNLRILAVPVRAR